ncbi:glycosyl hydrolase [Piscinibacter sp.]|uniref:glycosyl hydrolase n=1 Tax=Piscinibacter sp. TaxID=1903157 RepID=UPI002C7AE3AE|nr:glycosyl hydrolase [Albitalea sp.]HUG21482.1 glycosyl hydrolase [Albitalea sp.]
MTTRWTPPHGRLLAAMAITFAGVVAPLAEAAQVGAGSYRDGLPAGNPADPGWKGPSQVVSWGPGGVPNYGPAVPRFKPGVPAVSNKWWSGLAWTYWGTQSSGLNSVPNFPLPVAFMARPDGAGIWQADNPSVFRNNGGNLEWMAGTPIDGMELLHNHYPNSQYFHFYDQDLVAGLEGLASGDPLIAGYSDWAVTAEWSGGAGALQVTSASGSPYVFFRRTAGTANARIEVTGGMAVFHNSGNVIGVSVSKSAEVWRPGSMHHYLLVAPSGVNWQQGGSFFTAPLGAKGYFTVVAIPDTASATVTEFAALAHNHITDTRLSWSYNEGGATLGSTYTFTTQNPDNGGTGLPTLSAVFPHTWKGNLNNPVNTGFSFRSPRGEMKVVRGTSYTSNMRFNGVLPVMPVAGADVSRLNGYVNEIANDPSKLWQQPPEGSIDDAYWAGRAIGRAATLITIAAQTGNNAARDTLLAQVKLRLQDWFTYTGGEANKHWAYDPTWRTLCPIYDMHYACRDLSDHHFINGYFIRAAAIVALHDPNGATWVSQWGPMVEKLVKDPMNWDRGDAQFAFLRHYSPVEGHSWASGIAFGNGLNEESSSEGMNFATALTLWGMATGNKTIRDLGIMYYANQSRAIEEYWLDVDQSNHAGEFRPPHTGILWSNGNLYGTWWTPEPRAVLGINVLPITSGSVYFGRRADQIPRQLTALNQYQAKYESLPAPVAPGFKPLMGPMEWSDLFWSLQATNDPGAALAQFNANPGAPPEWGQTKADVYNFIAALANYGKLETSVTADLPSYNVFNKNGTKNYAAYNPGAATVCVSFSDGKKMNVAAKQLVVNGPACSTADTQAPSVPGALTVTGTTHNSVALKWNASTDNVGVTGYRVFRGTALVATVTGLTHTLTGLAANTTYSFTVRAIDAAGNQSAASNSVSAKTNATADTTAPTVPSGLAVTGVTSSSVSLKWNASTDSGGSGLAGYDVHRGSVKVGSTPAGTLTFTDTGLAANTSYAYAVRARDNAGNLSASSATVTGKTATGDTPPPPPPDTVSARSVIQAESYSAAEPRITKTVGGMAVGTTADGTWIRLSAIDFGTTSPVDFVMNVASGLAGSGSITLFKDSISPANQIATLGVGHTGGWTAWRQVAMNLATPTTGVRDLYIRFNTPYVDPNGLVNFDWIQFR